MRSRRVLIEVHHLVLISNVQIRMRSVATSASSPLFKQQGHKKKLTKQERRALAEEFVDNYRSSNEGKFPTISHARQHLGGSYYIMRSIVQELEYNFKMYGDIRHQTSQTREMARIVKSCSFKYLGKNARSSTTEKQMSYRWNVGVAVEVQGTAVVNTIVDKEPVTHDKVLESQETLLTERLVNVLAAEEISEEPGRSHQMPSETFVGIVQVQSSRKADQDSINLPKAGTSRGSAIDNQDEARTHTKGDVSIDSMVSRKLEASEVDSATNMEGSSGLQKAHVSVEVKQTSSQNIAEPEEAFGLPTKDGESSSKGSTIWDNLRSFAGGIVKLWKKR